MYLFDSVIIGFVAVFSITVCAIAVKVIRVTYQLHVLSARQRKVELDGQNVSLQGERVAPHCEHVYQYITIDT